MQNPYDSVLLLTDEEVEWMNLLPASDFYEQLRKATEDRVAPISAHDPRELALRSLSRSPATDGILRQRIGT